MWNLPWTFNLMLNQTYLNWSRNKCKPLTILISSQGIEHHFSCAHTPQNRHVWRKNRLVVEMGLTLLAQCHALPHFWSPCAFQTPTCLINLLSNQTLSNKSPYKLLYKKNSSISISKFLEFSFSLLMSL